MILLDPVPSPHSAPSYRLTKSAQSTDEVNSRANKPSTRFDADNLRTNIHVHIVHSKRRESPNHRSYARLVPRYILYMDVKRVPHVCVSSAAGTLSQ